MRIKSSGIMNKTQYPGYLSQEVEIYYVLLVITGVLNMSREFVLNIFPTVHS